jgi:hypothetical protein
MDLATSSQHWFLIVLFLLLLLLHMFNFRLFESRVSALTQIGQLLLVLHEIVSEFMMGLIKSVLLGELSAKSL